MAGQGIYNDNERNTGLLNVRVLYEDNHVICAIKPRGVLSQADGTSAPDMLTILKRYIKDKYKKQGDVYLGLVHRLDRPVGGVMAFARTSKAAGRLSEQIRERAVRKVYYTVLRGTPAEPSGRLEHMIYKDRSANLVRVSDIARPETGNDSNVAALGGTDARLDGNVDAIGGTNARPDENVTALDPAYAALDYCVLASSNNNADATGETALVRVGLLTGRPHQIRAQFAHIGHPVIGDRKYGAGDNYITAGPALWAASLEFTHPVNRSPLVISAPPPNEYPWNLFTEY